MTHIAFDAIKFLTHDSFHSELHIIIRDQTKIERSKTTKMFVKIHNFINKWSKDLSMKYSLLSDRVLL